MDEELQKLIEAAMADEPAKTELDFTQDEASFDEEPEAPQPHAEIDLEELVFTLRQIAAAVIDLKDQVEAQDLLIRDIAASQETLASLPPALAQVQSAVVGLSKTMQEDRDTWGERLDALAAAVETNHRLLDALEPQAIPVPTPLPNQSADVADLPRASDKYAMATTPAPPTAEDMVQTIKQKIEEPPEALEAKRPLVPPTVAKPKIDLPSRQIASPRLSMTSRQEQEKEKALSSSGTQDFGADTAKLISPFRIKETAKPGGVSSIRTRAIPSVREENARRELSETARMLLAGRRKQRLKDEAAEAVATVAEDEQVDAPPATEAPADDRTTTTEAPRRLSIAKPSPTPVTDDAAAAPKLRKPVANEAPMSVTSTQVTRIMGAPEEGPCNSGEVPLPPIVSKLQKMVFGLKMAAGQVLKAGKVPRGGNLHAEVAGTLGERSNALLREWLTRHNASLAQAQATYLQTSVARGQDIALFWSDELLARYSEFRTEWFVESFLDKIEKPIRKLDLADHIPLLEELAMYMELARIETKKGKTIYDPKRHQTRDGEKPRPSEFYHVVINGDFRSGYIDLNSGDAVRKATVHTTTVAKNH